MELFEGIIQGPALGEARRTRHRWPLGDKWKQAKSFFGGQVRRTLGHAMGMPYIKGAVELQLNFWLNNLQTKNYSFGLTRPCTPMIPKLEPRWSSSWSLGLARAFGFDPQHPPLCRKGPPYLRCCFVVLWSNWKLPFWPYPVVHAKHGQIEH